ncbi:replication factor C large subunit [Candidatus Pacearchaeota archaeon]|nr:replication factor C large subunit [Candidatus Pacearchaeota archaeon]
MTNQTWVENHRPKKFIDIKGQDYAIQRIAEFIKNFSANYRGKKAIVLYGPPGVGKTTLAHVAALETNSEIFELNASDLRNKSKLLEILKPAIQQHSLLKEKKIILVDEVDGISGTDRGGLPELLRLIALSKIPVIITANDIWKRNLSTLRQKTELIKLKEIDYKIIIEILNDVLKKEELILNPNIVKSIAIRAKGDIRAAINDLQSTSRMKDPSVMSFDERDKEGDIFTALKHVFKGKPNNSTLSIFDSVNMPLDEIILWVEENIPKDPLYDAKQNPEALAKAYERLSKVDVFKGRIYKQQYWRFMVYENLLLSYGISASKDLSQVPKNQFTSYKKPSRILKIWLHNQKTMKKKSIAQKYAALVHIGSKRALHEFPIIKTIIHSNPKIQKELKLTDEEIEYVMRG